jgi:hypothetical protein
MKKRSISLSLSLIILVSTNINAVTKSPDPSDVYFIDLNQSIPIQQQENSLNESLAAGKVIILQGNADDLKKIKPAWVHVWPNTDTVVIHARAGLGVYGLSDVDGIPQDLLRDIVLDYISWPSSEAHTNDAKNSVTKTIANDPIRKNINLTIRPAGPIAACVDFSNAVHQTMFENQQPSEPERNAVALEVAKWCQYGKLAGSESGFQVPLAEKTDIPKKMFDFEWAFIRDENLLVPERSHYLFWTKSTGDGSGSGFARNIGDIAFWKDNVVRNLFDVGIHGGWGSYYPKDPRSWAQPGRGEGEHWPSKEHSLFVCDDVTPISCPQGVKLIRLYPEDTFDNSVTVAESTAIALGGSLTLTPSASPSGPSFAAAFALNATYTSTQTATTTLSLTNVRSSATQTYSRSTRWRPNTAAVWDWVKASRIPNGGKIGNATPLAATLNPSYDVIWRVPTQGNTSKFFKYAIVSEVGVNHCVRTACSNYKQPPDKNIPPQRRIAWAHEAWISP